MRRPFGAVVRAARAVTVVHQRRRATLLAVVALVATYAASGFSRTPPPAQAPQPLVLRGATVITGTGAPPIPNATIVVDGETIQAVGANVAAPPGATSVDVAGTFIIPGLVESHAHYEEWMGELFLNHGVTSAFAIGGNFGRVKQESQRAATRAPRIFDTAGDPRINASMDEAQVREGVREWLKTGPDFARLRDYTPESSRAFTWAADEIHRGGLLVFGHSNNAPESVARGHDVVEHMWGFIIPLLSPAELEDFKRGRNLHWSLFIHDWPRIEGWMRDAIARGVYINPTLTYELGSLSAHAARHEREIYAINQHPSLAVYYPPNIAGSLLQKQRQIRNFSAKYENLVLLSRLTPDERQQFAHGYKLAGELLKRWVALGGKLQAGTDTISGGTPGLSLHHEMELLVEAGLTPMQALLSATSWSAEMLAGKNGARGRPKVGSIAPGMLADLLVLSADPLQAIANTTRIDRVMKGGRFVMLGYDPAYYSFSRPARSIAMATPRPEISGIEPHTVIEGSGDVDLQVRGIGFVGNSVIRVDGVSLPTTFVNPRVLRAKVPGTLVRSADPNPFDAPGPDQHTGIFGDRTISISVFNAPPEGGTSNSISLRVRAKWMGLDDDLLR